MTDPNRLLLEAAVRVLEPSPEGTFHGRGNSDLSGSHDLEDLITVIDGRVEIVDDVRSAAPDVRAYVSGEVGRLLGARAFVDALPGFLLPDSGSQARRPILLNRLRALAAIDGPA